MDRRTWLKLAASTAAAAALPYSGLRSRERRYSHALLGGLARQLSARELRRIKPYKPFEKRVDEALASVPYDKYDSAIVYKEDQAIWRKEAVPFWLEPYHTAGDLIMPIRLTFTPLRGRRRSEFLIPPRLSISIPPAKPAANARAIGFRRLSGARAARANWRFQGFPEFPRRDKLPGDRTGQVFGVWRPRLRDQHRPGGRRRVSAVPKLLDREARKPARLKPRHMRPARQQANAVGG